MIWPIVLKVGVVAFLMSLPLSTLFVLRGTTAKEIENAVEAGKTALFLSGCVIFIGALLKVFGV